MLKIIVLEEDAAMRTLIREWLLGAGHDAVESACASASLDGAPQAGVDVVVASLVDLPGRGQAAMRRIRARYPGARVVGTSTQLAQALPGSSGIARALGVERLVPKPCTRAELLHAVEQAAAVPSAS